MKKLSVIMQSMFFDLSCLKDLKQMLFLVEKSSLFFFQFSHKLLEAVWHSSQENQKTESTISLNKHIHCICSIYWKWHKFSFILHNTCMKTAFAHLQQEWTESERNNQDNVLTWWKILRTRNLREKQILWDK